MTSLTRRALAAAGLAAAALPARGQVTGKRPLVIAHRGASGQLPEHTLSCYLLAIQQGADYIEPDLVVTKDGILVARHENEISATTDVGSKPNFARRKKTKTIDGKPVEGWFVEDFTLAELKTLRARERLPNIRPANTKYDGNEAIPTFHQIVELARTESAKARRTIGVYPEMKHPSYFRSIGLALEPRLAAALKTQSLDSRSSPVFVQSFEPEALRRFRRLSPVRRVQLIAAEGGPADQKGGRYADMLTPAGLKGIKAYADGIGVELPLVLKLDDGALGPPTPLVGNAHAAGLQVHAWTVRAENHFLPASLQRGTAPDAYGDVHSLLRALYSAGVDGVFSDFPWVAVQVRGGK
ncbi:glycerophosphodiester phosphodiesterase [Phenylobacterium sp.]|jgi:glycerophosphoryl diester phosphodiesterase|uniref:glycerophosphodiester phosphodiesterase n=1 Tax=Phenylobacterium sp. TaxID=1871053 RepID=UPI002E31F4B6|nr:glycerophosphodiester phosphodiesterase [Phenylobacterium sp.]HEX2558654.1 glycerophosphodiester phosphodiesterase [Phenylobacterium sp.]